jgi:hypothetical protein
MNVKRTCIGSVCFLLGAAAIHAQAQAPEDDDYVSREEHDALRRDFEALKRELETTQQDRAEPRPQGDDQQPTWLELERSRLRIEALEQAMEETKGGLSSFHVTGYAFTSFVSPEGADSTFSAQFVPLFLWQVTDRLLFEAEVEFGLESVGGEGTTHVELEYADASYIINDYVTLGAGKFLTPFGLFGERLHPAWINKFPDSPLIYGHGGLVPFTSLGIFARGGVPVGSTMFNYAVYLSNGAALNTGTVESDEAGVLHFENWDDINNNKSVGGRVGFLPIPEIELGFSFNWGRVNPSGSDVGDADALLLGFDVTYVQEVDFLGGLFDVRFEYARSDVDDVTYDPTGALGFGPLTYDNVRDGLYTQVAYRPTKCNIEFLRDFEVVGRYDYLNLPAGAPENEDTQRWSLGVNYWLNPSTVLKLAYENLDVEGAPSTNTFLAMFAIGF